MENFKHRAQASGSGGQWRGRKSDWRKWGNKKWIFGRDNQLAVLPVLIGAPHLPRRGAILFSYNIGVINEQPSHFREVYRVFDTEFNSAPPTHVVE